MSSYLPFGTEIIQEEETMKYKMSKFKQYDYYGIPYGQFDSPEGECCISLKEKDREKARALILKGEAIPNDLAMRLMQYKKDEARKNKNKSTKISQ